MKKFAVFDIDGTLIRWQLYHAIVDKLAKQNLLGQNSLETIRNARMRWKNREANYSFRDYEQTLIAVFEDALQQLRPAELEQAADEVISEYRQQAYTYTRDLVKVLQSQDYLLLAISGSHHELVERLARSYGFDDFIGTQYKRANQKFTGEKLVPSFDKAAALQTFVEKYQLDFTGSYGVGDSKSDASMLEMVERPIAFNPDRELYYVASKNGWKIVVERKNMIYQLEQHSDQYILV